MTGNFGVGFTIRGTIFIQTQPGKSPFIFELSDSVSAAGGVSKLVSVGGTGSLPGGRSQDGGLTGRHDTLVARGADGAIYRKVADVERRQSRDAGWALAAPMVETPVTALSAGLAAQRSSRSMPKVLRFTRRVPAVDPAKRGPRNGSTSAAVSLVQ